MSAALLVISPETALHAFVAIRRYRDQAADIPDELVDLEFALAEIARGGNDRPETVTSRHEPSRAVTRRAVAETEPVSHHLTIKEAAALSGLSESTLDRLRRAGDLASEKVGRSRRFRRTDVEALMGGER